MASASGNRVEEAVHRTQAVKGAQKVAAQAPGAERGNAADQHQRQKVENANQVAGKNHRLVVDAGRDLANEHAHDGEQQPGKG